MIPSMYLIAERLKRPWKILRDEVHRFAGFPEIYLLFIFVGLMYLVRWVTGRKVEWGL